MARDTLIIKESDVKARTTMSLHADPKWWASVIHAVQLATARPILGEALFRELQEQTADNTLTVANTTLLTELSYGLAWRVYAKALKANSLRMENLGNRRNKDDHSDEATLAEVKSQVMDADNLADTYLADFVRWLTDNAADYPLYEPGCKKATVRKSSIYNVRSDYQTRL